MKDKKALVVVLGASVVLVAVFTGILWRKDAPTALGSDGLEQDAQVLQASAEEGSAPAAAEEIGQCGDMDFGSFRGQVSYDEEEDYYYLQLRGARFPFKASPLDALAVPVQAPGKDAKEKNTALLYGIMGAEVDYATILVNPDEEEEVMPAAIDLARYIKIVNPRKLSGLAYTKAGGKLQRSVQLGSQIQSWEEATAKTPRILLRGPTSGGKSTRVVVRENGMILVEGETYEALYKAADLICVTLLKMLCGSPDCPDAAACATGGKCGC